MTAEPRRRQRTDARDNREQILLVAGRAFADDGPEVPVREIARRAQVGVATVYRHFPTKQDLLTEALAEKTSSCVSIVAGGLAHDDPWRGFQVVVEELMSVHARDRGFARRFTSQMPGAEIVTADRARSLRLLLRLAQRAKDAGALRADFVLEDLVLLLMANEGIRAPTRGMKAAASRRFTALALESLHTGPPPTNFPPPVRLPLIPEAVNPQSHA